MGSCRIVLIRELTTSSTVMSHTDCAKLLDRSTSLSHTMENELLTSLCRDMLFDIWLLERWVTTPCNLLYLIG